MNKILRLSRANLRKHKTEAVLTAVLIMFCMLLLGSSLSASRSMKDLFPIITEKTGTLKNMIGVVDEGFDTETFRHILENDDRIEKLAVVNCLEASPARILNDEGEEQDYPIALFTEENERKYEIYQPESTLSEEEAAAIAHPIILPAKEKRRLGIREGDTFDVIIEAKRFSFTVAGFYSGGYFDGLCAKCIISDADAQIMKNVCSRRLYFNYNAKDDADNSAIAEDAEKCYEDIYGEEHSYIYVSTYEDNLLDFRIRISFILTVMTVMAVIIILSVSVMVRHQIVNAIQDQIVSIGVLEALGYQSREIAMSYAAEYFLLALAGCTAGLAGCFLLTPALVTLGAHMSGFDDVYTFSIMPFILSFAAILLLTFAVAYLKARSVRKYPPVLAFRKGIRTHNFKRSHFPLRNTKKNVHLRLAMKGFTDHAARNIGLTFVMTVTSVAVLLSFVLFSFLGDSEKAAISIAGHEMSDLQVGIETTTDAAQFEAELRALPALRRVEPTVPFGAMFVRPVTDREEAELAIDAYSDYSRTENIFPKEGRFPEHDNEVMLTVDAAAHLNMKTGDTVTLKMNNTQQQYLVTGTVSAFVNSASVYMTFDGLKRLDPLFEPTTFELYLKDGESTDDLIAELDRRYGKSVGEISKETESTGSYEERIRRTAERQMAEMMKQNDVSYVSYAIQCGDSVITGDSSAFQIRYIDSIRDLLVTSLADYAQTLSLSTVLLTVMSAVVVMIILFILMGSEIRKQRKELGIMKGLGYTSKELMLQLSCRIMPFVTAAVCIGTVLTYVARKILIQYLAVLPISLPGIVIVDLLMIGFCFLCAYVGARRIRKISVCELMTE